VREAGEDRVGFAGFVLVIEDGSVEGLFWREVPENNGPSINGSTTDAIFCILYFIIKITLLKMASDAHSCRCHLFANLAAVWFIEHKRHS
jgi:hypothetical protein